MRVAALKSLRCLVSLAALTGVCAPVAAQMIGDTLTIRRLYPDLNSDALPPVMVLVAAGPSDLIRAFDDSVSNNFVNTFDPEATSIMIRWTGSSAYVGTPLLVDGFGFSGFSHLIDGVSVSGLNGIGVVDLGFTPSSIWINMTGPFNGSAGLDLEIVFQPVPEPATYGMLLAGLLVVGAAAARRGRHAETARA